jgi:hypothetical protein
VAALLNWAKAGARVNRISAESFLTLL